MNTTDKSLYEITGDIKDINTLLVGRAEIEALVRERDELMRLLKIVRGKHGAGILALPPADLERFDSAMQEKQS